MPSSQPSTHTAAQPEPPSRRLTRSTYTGDPDPESRRKRSSSTDSENGWIPPPPLLALDTHFLLTNAPPPCPRPTAPTLPSDFSFAHLRCPAPQPRAPAALQPMFRLLADGELGAPKRSRLDDEPVGQDDDLAEAISRRHRAPEMLEKRMKRREKERLVHERFKLQAHLALLQNPLGTDWKSVRALALRRIKEDERTGSMGVGGERETEKVDRMRWVMVKEAQETLKRYETLLTRKQPKSKPPPLPSSEQLIDTLVSNSSAPPKSVRRSQPTPNSDELPVPPPPKRPFRISIKLKPPEMVPKAETISQSHSSRAPTDPPEEVEMNKESTPDRTEGTAELPQRESLYDSPNLRRSILEENGRRRAVARVSYAFGSKIPELSQIKWNTHGLRLESFALAQGLTGSPFKLDSDNHRESRGAKDWTEFNPLVNEERALVERQEEYGEGSTFFELMDELECVEQEMEDRGEGPSIRKLMVQRIEESRIEEDVGAE